MASTMEGMLKAMDNNRPSKPQKFLERSLKLLRNATEVNALGLADGEGAVLIHSGRSPLQISDVKPNEKLSWRHDEELVQLRIELEVEAFNVGVIKSLLPLLKKKGGRERPIADRVLRDRRGPPNPKGGRAPTFNGEEGAEPVEKYELLILDVPVKAQLKALSHDLTMRFIIALSSLVAIGAILWMIRRQEFLQLAQSQLREQEQLRKGLEEKNLAALGLAHETRTPLSVLRGHAQLNADDTATSEEVRDRSLIIVDEVDRITSRLNDFISYARQPSPDLAPHHIRELVDKVLDLLRLDLEDKQIELKADVDDVQVSVDGSMMVQVVFNLLMNAVQIIPQGGSINLFTKVRGAKVDLHVVDDGPGFPKEDGESCFQPYVTHREGGTGLGLAVVQQILSVHGASLELLPSKKGAHLLIKGLQKQG